MDRQAEPSLPLTMADSGQRLRLVSIGGDTRRSHRLTELGLTPGVELVVLRDDGGALLIAVGDTRLALGRGLAQRVFVTSVP